MPGIYNLLMESVQDKDNYQQKFNSKTQLELC